MPRIRTIKPEFWSDEKLGPLDPLTRLVFLGLLSMSDDTGRIVDSIRAIDGFIFPLTDDTAGPSLTLLATLDRITRGATDSGQRIIQIVNWGRHQKIDKPNIAAALPPVSAKRPRKIGDPSARTTPKIAEPSTLHIYDLRSTTNDLRSTTTREKKKPRAVVDTDFETTWLQYPERRGGNSKSLALRAWAARRNSGVAVVEMAEGVARYARFCTATGKVGGEYVMQTATFLGPGEHWRELWALPVVPVDPREQRGIAPPPNKEQREAEGKRFAVEQDRESRIDRAYHAARSLWLVTWLPTADAERVAAIRAKADQVLAGSAGELGRMAREGLFEMECARLGEFPDRDAWVIIENTRRRAKVAS